MRKNVQRRRPAAKSDLQSKTSLTDAEIEALYAGLHAIPAEWRGIDLELIEARYGRAAMEFVQGPPLCRCGKPFASLAGGIFLCPSGHKKQGPADDVPAHQREATLLLSRAERSGLQKERRRLVQPLQEGRRRSATEAERERERLRADAERLYESGKTPQAIADILGKKHGRPVSRKVVRRILRLK